MLSVTCCFGESCACVICQVCGCPSVRLHSGWLTSRATQETGFFRKPLCALFEVLTTTAKLSTCFAYSLDSFWSPFESVFFFSRTGKGAASPQRDAPTLTSFTGETFCGSDYFPPVELVTNSSGFSCQAALLPSSHSRLSVRKQKAATCFPSPVGLFRWTISIFKVPFYKRRHENVPDVTSGKPALDRYWGS